MVQKQVFLTLFKIVKPTEFREEPKKMQTYKPDSVSRKLETLIIYLDLQLLVSSSYLPFSNEREALKC